MSSQLQVTGEAKIRDIQGPVVANSGVISALDGAASQYVRGDGTLADFPTSSGGGSSVSYYLNSSVSQGTIDGVAYRELSKDPIVGAGTDIAISANGYVANYITDANDPDVTIVPGGNFNCEFYFSVNNNTGNPTTYAELYKYDGTTFTLLGTSAGVPESINQGTTIAPYYFAIPVATASLAITDRLAIRIYVNVDGRTVTLHTENSHLCQVVTTLSKGMVSLNNLTDQSQYLTTGTSGTNFAIVSSGDTHTFNLPVASATNTGKLSSTDWSTFNNKLSTATAAATYVPYTGATTNVDLGFFNFDANQINGFKIIAKLDGTNSGSLILRTGTSGYSYGNDSISLISSPTSANTLTIVSDVSLVTKIAQIGLGSLTATRTYTLPDLSGTLALLEGTQTFSGAKTFSGLASFTNTSGINLQYGAYINKGNTPLAFSSGTTNIYSDATTNNIVIRDNSSIAKLEFNNSTQTYTFPASSGTIALTSNLSSYVPYTGATSNVNLGVYDISVSGIKVESNVSGGTAVNIKQNSTTLIAGAGYISIGAKDLDTLLFQYGGATNSDYKVIRLKTTNIPNTTSRAYEFPNADGTIALTSNLSSYLPLAGGTLTGALTGTSATFSSLESIRITNDNGFLSFYNTANTTRRGYIQAQSNNISIAAEAGFLDLLGSSGTGLRIGSTGAATFSSSVTATAGIFNLNTTNGGFKVTGVSATPSTLSYLANNYFAKFFTRSDQNYGITIFDQSEATAIQSADLVNGNNAKALILNPYGGNVGIGTSSPSSLNAGANQLVVGNGSSTQGLTIYTGSASDGNIYFANGTTGSQAYNGAIVYNHSSNYMIFATNGGTERMRITSAGNVGIGTSSPQGALEVVGLSYFTRSSQTTLLNPNYGGAGTHSQIQVVGNMALAFATNGDNERMRITSGGNVGIGTSTAPYLLTLALPSGVNGEIIRMSRSAGAYAWSLGIDSATSHFNFYNNSSTSVANINLSTGAYTATSDERLKENILDSDNAIEKLLQIKVRKYDWKDTDIKEDYGFVAQELYDVLPQYVSKGDEDRNWGVAKAELVPILVKAIQELESRIKQLENK